MDSHKYLKDLFQLLSIPSVSAQPEHKSDMKRAAVWLKKKLTSLGFETNILPTRGHPVVYAEYFPPTTYNSPSQRLSRAGGLQPTTVLIYGHYDVQSPDPLSEWKSDPFKPLVKNGNIYARGVADDKGQLYTWIAALEELMASDQRPKANIKFLIEGEEEVGSENLADFIRENKEMLKADICVVSDTHCLSEKQPMIDYGLRGIVYTEVKVKTLKKDVHSGIYGGNVLNPIQVLSQLINKLKDDNHIILIPGFYENVRKVNTIERKKLDELPFKEKEVLEETGALLVAGEKGLSVHERAGARPTLEVNGIWGGYQGDGPKTIIPAEAHAKISMRIVPNQTSSEVYKKFETYLKTLVPKGVDLEVKLISTAEASLTNTGSKYFKASENAYNKVFGKKPVYELSGGTIGAVSDLKSIMGIDSIMMGYGLPDDGLHSPNEKFSLEMFENGIKTNMEFLKSL